MSLSRKRRGQIKDITRKVIRAENEPALEEIGM
jgi:hypothetical protein